MDPTELLKNWLQELHLDFGSKSPPPDKFDQIIITVEGHFNTHIGDYVGKGDNGIVFKTNDGNVLKFTIDNKEAILWGKLQQSPIAGIAKSSEVINLASSKTGETILFVIKTAFIPYPITDKQKNMINNAMEKAEQTNFSRMKYHRINKTKDNIRYNEKTGNFVKEFQKLANVDHSFAKIPEMLMDISDTHQAFIYDLRPDNFKRDEEGYVTLIDPSTPEIMSQSNKPQPLMFEEKLLIALNRTILV